VATQTPSAGSTSPTTRLVLMMWTVILQLCGASVSFYWNLFWQPTSQQPVLRAQAACARGMEACRGYVRLVYSYVASC